MPTKKEVTKDDVLRYIYHETSKEEKHSIQKAILEDAELQEMFYDFVSLKKDLDQAAMKPSNSTVQKILNYTRNHKSTTKTSPSGREFCKIQRT